MHRRACLIPHAAQCPARWTSSGARARRNVGELDGDGTVYYYMCIKMLLYFTRMYVGIRILFFER